MKERIVANGGVPISGRVGWHGAGAVGRIFAAGRVVLQCSVAAGCIA